MAKRKRSYSRRPYRRKRRNVTSYIGEYTGSVVYPQTTKSGTYGPSNAQIRRMLEANPSDPRAKRTEEQGKNRLMDGYYGPGAFWPDVGKWGSRAIGGLAGAGAGFLGGGAMGAATGAVEGWGKGAAFSRAMGWGSYDVGRKMNDLAMGDVGGNGTTPVIHTSAMADEGGDIYISNRELVKLVKSSETPGEYKLEQFTLNPADSTFQHLRQIAENYEQFEFGGLVFQYIPMYGEGGNSNAIGSIGMATNYDPSQPRNPADLEALTRYKGAMTSKPSVGLVSFVECDPAKRAVKKMFVRDNVDRDKGFTDPGVFLFASESIPEANALLGQLWVSYTVKLSVHKLRDTDLLSNIQRLPFTLTMPSGTNVAGPGGEMTSAVAEAVPLEHPVNFIEAATDITNSRVHYQYINLKDNQLGTKFLVVVDAKTSSADPGSVTNWEFDNVCFSRPEGVTFTEAYDSVFTCGVYNNPGAADPVSSSAHTVIEITDNKNCRFTWGYTIASGASGTSSSDWTQNCNLRFIKLDDVKEDNY